MTEHWQAGHTWERLQNLDATVTMASWWRLGQKFYNKKEVTIKTQVLLLPLRKPQMGKDTRETKEPEWKEDSRNDWESCEQTTLGRSSKSRQNRHDSQYIRLTIAGDWRRFIQQKKSRSRHFGAFVPPEKATDGRDTSEAIEPVQKGETATEKLRSGPQLRASSGYAHCCSYECGRCLGIPLRRSQERYHTLLTVKKCF